MTLDTGWRKPILLAGVPRICPPERSSSITRISIYFLVYTKLSLPYVKHGASPRPLGRRIAN